MVLALAIIEKLTSFDRLCLGAPFLLTAVVLHGLGLCAGLSLLRMRPSLGPAAGTSPAVGAMTLQETAAALPAPAPPTPAAWLAGELFLLLALPLVWWFGFLFGPDDLTVKGVVNSIGEPLLVAAFGVGYLALRRRLGEDRVGVVHFGLLALAMGISGLIGWLCPMIDFGLL
ncbi:MAG: hypothetical protein FJ293_15345 [Planctomycetes bacterium]|nr:hypothetical protein [Planctomycetota bacterium]